MLMALDENEKIGIKVGSCCDENEDWDKKKIGMLISTTWVQFHLSSNFTDIKCDNLARCKKQIQARAKSGPMPPGLATELLNEIKSSGLLPNVIIYTTLIRSCSRWSNFDEGVKTYDDMVASNCRPDLHTYSAMISLYGRDGKAKEAEKFIKELKSKGISSKCCYLCLFNPCIAKEEDIEKVREISEEMDKVGIAKDEIIYNAIIQMYIKCGLKDLALCTYNDMLASHCRPTLHTYNTMISLYGRCGMAKEAEEVFKELKSKGLVADVVTYSSLINSFAKERNVEKVGKICREMAEVGIAKNVITYTTIIQMYSKGGQHDLALHTYNDMLASNCQPTLHTYTAMISLYGRLGMAREAEKLYLELQSKGFSADVFTYNSLMDAFAKEGNKEKVEEICKEMDALGILR